MDRIKTAIAEALVEKKEGNLEVYTDKRAFERLRHNAIIEYSYFNRDQYYPEAQTLNHSDGGICFKAVIPLRPGATVLIRAKNLYPNGACNGDCRGVTFINFGRSKMV